MIGRSRNLRGFIKLMADFCYETTKRDGLRGKKGRRAVSRKTTV